MAGEKEHKNKCSSCTLYIVLIATISIRIGIYLVYYKYINQNKEKVSKYNYVYQAINY